VTREAADRIRYVLQSSGWQDIQKLIDDGISERTEALLELMDSRPDSLTGKTAIKLAAGRKALKDLKEEILGSQRLLAPQPRRAGD